MDLALTSLNTGLNLGACSLIESSSADKKFFLIACRHHVFEVKFSSAYKEVFGPSGRGPDVNLFKRFQKQWLEIYQDSFTIGRNNFFNTKNLLKLCQIMHEYYIDAIKTQTPRDDYLELLKLSDLSWKASKN